MLRVEFVMIFGLVACCMEVQSISRNHARKKRIVDGRFVSKYHSYPVLQYQAAVTNGIQAGLSICNHLYPRQGLNGSEVQADSVMTACTERIDIKCGGALITMNAVQTTCNCLASQVNVLKKRNRYMPRTVTVWESYAVIHVGVLRLRDMNRTSARFSREFHIHEKCSHMASVIWHYDFGVIMLNLIPDDNIPPFPQAPFYREDELNEIWLNVTANEYVCMHVGYGKTTWTAGVYANRARHLSHSWRLITNRQWCNSFYKGLVSGEIYSKDDEEKRDGKPRYEDLSDINMQACSRHLGKFNGIPAPDDTGYPITCQSWYFAVQSMSTPPENATLYGVGFSMPIKLTPMMNAAEYRRSFAEYVETDFVEALDRPVSIQSNNTIPGFHPLARVYGIWTPPKSGNKLFNAPWANTQPVSKPQTSGSTAVLLPHLSGLIFFSYFSFDI